MGTLATDDFNRAAIGANWTALTGWVGLSISASTIAVGTFDPGGSYYNATTPPSADYWAQCTIIQRETVANEGGGPAIRMSSSATTAYFAIANTAGGHGLELWKVVANTYTQISEGTAVAANDVIYLQAIGSALTVKKNGTSIYTPTDSAISAAGFAGAAAFFGTTTPQIDDWSFGSLSPSISLVAANPLINGQTGYVITGSSFGASQGAGSVIISPTDNVADGSAVTQTVTAWGDTSITFTAVRSALGHGMLYLFVKDNSANSNASGYLVSFLDTPAVAWLRA